MAGLSRQVPSFSATVAAAFGRLRSRSHLRPFNAICGTVDLNRPVVVSCHDLLAVRGALGEVPDAPASATGKYLQRWVVSGLRKATAIACVSTDATLRDALRIVRQKMGARQLSRIYLGNNHPIEESPPNACGSYSPPSKRPLAGAPVRPARRLESKDEKSGGCACEFSP